MLKDYPIKMEDFEGKYITLDVLATDKKDAINCAKDYMGKEWKIVEVGEEKNIKW